MRAILYLFSILFVLFAGLTQLSPIFASHTIDDTNISVDYGEKPLTAEKGKITITITSKNSYFDTNATYSYSAWPTAKPGFCVIYNGTVKAASTSSIIVTWNFTVDCMKETGDWTFKLWLKDAEKGLIVKDFHFKIADSLRIEPEKPAYGPGETARVIVLGANQGVTYTFWWEGSRVQLAGKQRALDNSGKLTVPLSGDQTQSPGEPVLCMHVGDTPVPRDCQYRAKFTFLPGTPDQSLSCTINVPTPPTAGEVSMKGLNVPKNKDFKATLTPKGQSPRETAPLNSGTSGIVTFIIGANLAPGSYTGSIFELPGNQLTCEQQFNIIGGTGTGQCSGDNCSQAAGIFCDTGTGQVGGAEDGILTAIGCIPTEPSKLINAILTVAAVAGGGIALLLMAFGSFQIITSQGNPEVVKKGRDRFQAAAIGLVFILFSVLILKVIGVDILNIPGFGLK